MCELLYIRILYFTRARGHRWAHETPAACHTHHGSKLRGGGEMESITEKGRIEEEEWVGDDEKAQGECRLYWVSS